jgi:hypothetical protein
MATFTKRTWENYLNDWGKGVMLLKQTHFESNQSLRPIADGFSVALTQTAQGRIRWKVKNVLRY